MTATRLLTPAAKKPRPFPRLAAIVYGAALALSWPIAVGGRWGPIDLVCKIVASLAACSVAVWLEDRAYGLFLARRRIARVAASLAFPLLGGIAAAGAAVLFGLGARWLRDDGTVMLSLLLGSWWLAGAAAGSAVVVLIDTVVSALVPDFRGRVQLAVLSLVLFVAAGAVGVFALGHELASLLHRLYEEGQLSTARVDLGGEILQGPALEHWLAQPETAMLLGFGAALVALFAGVPALLSACGKVADAVMERLHPLALAFEEVGGGKLDVRVEEAGSRDFVKISAGFNRMAGSLEATVGDLDQKNRELGETNRAAVRFVPQPFLQLLDKASVKDIERGDQVELDISVSFSDIRGFTTMAEAMGAAASFAFVNRYLAAVEPAIHRESGFINDIMGDGVMALFHRGRGGEKGGADAAVRAALGHLAALGRLNGELEREGKQPVQVGVGINSGALMLGTIGGSDRLSCTVIGDPANFASRIEGMTKLYGATLLLSEHTRERLADPRAYTLREIDRVQAKGKHVAARIYEVLDALPPAERDDKFATMVWFDEALAAYRAGSLADAKPLFAKCARLAPCDRAATLYLERCDEWLARGLPPGWDGTSKLESK